MLIAPLPPLAAALFSVLAIASLLLSFVMLGSRWLKQYLYAFAAESWMIAGISAAVGFFDHVPELYLIAGLTVAFRGLMLPWLIWRMIDRLTITYNRTRQASITKELIEIISGAEAL